MSAIDQVLQIMARLRDPETGCPWDVQQNFQSIAPYTIEEAYEVADAIDRGDFEDLKDELGDLLLQVVFHAQMAAEAKFFKFDDVAKQLAKKLIRRHPHVFADSTASSEAELHEAWEQHKVQERRAKQSSLEKPTPEKNEPAESLLAGITQALPALKRAQKLQKRAARAGFDWPEIEPVYAKVQEELTEVRHAVDATDVQQQHEEIGDLLFAVVNLARHARVDAEEALRLSNNKFTRRFQKVEQGLRALGRDLHSSNLEEMDAIWERVKHEEKQE